VPWYRPWRRSVGRCDPGRYPDRPDRGRRDSECRRPTQAVSKASKSLLLAAGGSDLHISGRVHRPYLVLTPQRKVPLRLQRRGRRFEPVTAHLVKPLVKKSFFNRMNVRKECLLRVPHMFPKRTQNPCLPCSVQDAVVMVLRMKPAHAPSAFLADRLVRRALSFRPARGVQFSPGVDTRTIRDKARRKCRGKGLQTSAHRISYS
jgi:hypothetical protein